MVKTTKFASIVRFSGAVEGAMSTEDGANGTAAASHADAPRGNCFCLAEMSFGFKHV